MNAITISHLRRHVAQLRKDIQTDIGRLEKLPEMSLSQRAEHLRSRINARQIVVADLEKLIEAWGADR